MNPGAVIGLLGFSLGVIACCIVRWGLGPASACIDDALAQLADDDELMAVADAVQIDEPIPYLPVDSPLITDQDSAWLSAIGVQA